MVNRAARAVGRLRAAARAHHAPLGAVMRRSTALRRDGWRVDDAALLGLLDPALDLTDAASWAVRRGDLYDAQDALNAGADLDQLDDKRRFAELAAGRGLPVAPRAMSLDPGPTADGTVRAWAEALAAHAPAEAVIKPAGGMSGRGVLFARRDGHGVVVEGRGRLTWAELARRLADVAPAHVVESRLRPHPAVRDLTGQDGLATLRIITLAPPDAPPEVVYAVARIPVGGSLVDNFRVAGGGVTGNLLAAVGDDGRLRTPFRVAPGGFGLERVPAHPDSGATLDGMPVPLWDECRAAALRGAAAFRDVPVIGWDVASAEDGAVIVEGNGGWAATADPDGGLVTLLARLRSAASR